MAQLDDYILPRYRSLDAPLLAVVGGSTGAGKSTLVNALVGHAVTRAGAIRPTTRQPILLHHPADARWFEGQRVLPSLSRIRGTVVDSAVCPANQAGPAPDAGDAITSLVLVADPAVPQGIALLDAPDVDSVSDDNRRLAGQLLAAADLWVFVTTANRYADAVPWRLLLDAASRDIMVAVVLDRVPPAAEAEVSADLQSMLSREGLGAARLFVVPEVALDGLGDAPGRRRGAAAALACANWQRTPPDAPTSPAGRSTAPLRPSAAASRRLARAVAEQQRRGRSALGRGRPARLSRTPWPGSLRPPGTAPCCAARSWPGGRTSSGTGRVLPRHGAEHRPLPRPRGRLLPGRTGAGGAGRNGDRNRAAGRHRRRSRQRGRRYGPALALRPGGRQLLGSDDLSGTSEGFADAVAAEIRAWQGGLMELIRTEGQGKRTQARWLSFGINGLGAALMIVVFSMTAGLTGLEIGVAGGTAVVGQRLLEAVFGEDAVRRLAQTAREDLHDRCQVLLQAEQRAFPEPARRRRRRAAGGACRPRGGAAPAGGLGMSRHGAARVKPRGWTAGLRP